MNFSGIILPELKALGFTSDLQALLGPALLNPLQEFLSHPGKNIRPRLVELGYQLSLEKEDQNLSDEIKRKLSIGSTIIEAIHAGSLIIDDIQDESTVRRSLPTLHLTHGLPKALNAGNWLYFWALEQIKEMKLDPEFSQMLVFDCLELMTRAHYGQAIDVGVRIDEVSQDQIEEVCLASMELKTGTLFSFALRLGMAANSECRDFKKIKELGSKFGVCLQAYDDVGNFLAKMDLGPSKRHEDLKLRRPTWIWAEASKYHQDSYQGFMRAISLLPDETELELWKTEHQFEENILSCAKTRLHGCVNEFKGYWGETHPQSFKMIKDIATQLERAYVRA